MAWVAGLGAAEFLRDVFGSRAKTFLLRLGKLVRNLVGSVRELRTRQVQREKRHGVPYHLQKVSLLRTAERLRGFCCNLQEGRSVGLGGVRPRCNLEKHGEQVHSTFRRYMEGEGT